MTQDSVPKDTHPTGPAHDALMSDELRLQMLKFATLQLRDSHLAEDAVQEALLGAFRHAQAFAGRAAYKTWVFAILKNKIADLLRKNQRLVNISSLTRTEDDGLEEALFNQRGMWQRDERPVAWSSPEGSAEDSQFWRIFEACLDDLPPNQGRVFMMREFVGLESRDICAELEIGVSNLNVLLYRARLRLRECLENKWYLDGDCRC
ncbi:RNA polymerase factor sigma-70 [Zobellella aerophila]|uniref:RNA polymerase factor sigma-70 n=1 Tax=Zobellella aerophila TaxID=870480 RepID=A0ABP6V4Q3_9GAMM